jgi:exonuclease SbcC
MDIQRLKLHGFTGVKKGMGLDTVELDLSDVSGLVGIWGPTGKGKTTIMESLQPFPQMISRPEPALKNHVCLRDACKELDFIHNGQLWETRVVLDSKTGRSEGFITIDGTSKVNGKITDFKRYLGDALGSPNLFFNSVFCAQNSQRISNLRPAELKALFAEFLADKMARYIEWEDTSKTAHGITTGQIAAVEKAMERQKDTLAETEQATVDLAAAEVKLQDLLRESNQRRQEVEFQSKTLGNLREKAAKQEQIAKQCAETFAQAKTAREHLRKLQEAGSAEMAVNQQKALTTKMEMEGCEKKAEGIAACRKGAELVAEMDEKIAELRSKLPEAKAALDAAAKAAETYRNQCEDIRADLIAKKGDAVKAKMNNDVEGEKLRGKLEKARSDSLILLSDGKIDNLATGIENAKAKVEMMESCIDPACESTTCGFIQDALEAKRVIPEMERQAAELIAKRELKVAELDARIDELKAAVSVNRSTGHWLHAEIDGCEDALREAEQEYTDHMMVLTEKRDYAFNKVSGIEYDIDGLVMDRDKAKQDAAALPEMEAAAARAESLKARYQELVEDGLALRSSWDERRRVAAGHLADLAQSADELSKQVDAEIDTRIRKQESMVELQQRMLNDDESAIVECRTEMATLQKQAEARVKAEKELDELTAERNRLVQHAADWAYLQIANGRDGLRALEIDAVAPTISSFANQLLEVAFGSWAMVDFRTLDDETNKEVLEPRVIDQDGDSVLIGNRSGGQQVWALKALRLAMTVISKQQSRRDFLTAYADEDDAGLDVETAQSFTALYKAFIDLGGFSKVFMITHKSECAAMADHIITLNGGVVVE